MEHVTWKPIKKKVVYLERKSDREIKSDRCNGYLKWKKNKDRNKYEMSMKC